MLGCDFIVVRPRLCVCVVVGGDRWLYSSLCCYSQLYICFLSTGVDLGIMSSPVAVTNLFLLTSFASGISWLLFSPFFVLFFFFLSFLLSSLDSLLVPKIFSRFQICFSLYPRLLVWVGGYFGYRSSSGEWEGKELICSFAPHWPLLPPGRSCLNLTKPWVMLYVHKLCTSGAHVGGNRYL